MGSLSTLLYYSISQQLFKLFRPLHYTLGLHILQAEEMDARREKARVQKNKPELLGLTPGRFRVWGLGV